MFGVDIQSGDVRGDSPSYALVVLDGDGKPVITFASTDWTMSLDPEWFSTIYPWLYLVSQALTAACFAILVLRGVVEHAPHGRVMQTKHFHDFGNLLLALVWTAATGTLTALNLLVGYAVGYGVMAVARPLLQRMLRDLADRTFNRVTVDGDTSTNDACVLISTGRVKVATLNAADDALYAPLWAALEAVFMELAQALVRDGEGASKFVTVAVSGGESEAECLQVAFTVAESPLVKTALFASDPNWGRILAAIGRAGVPHLAVDAVTVRLNGVLIAEQGGRAETYTEEQGAGAMAAEANTERNDIRTSPSRRCRRLPAPGWARRRSPPRWLRSRPRDRRP